MSRDTVTKYEKSQFGKNIKFLRTSVLHITQATLAEMANISQHTISEFENNPKPNIKLKNLVSIAKTLNVSIDDILTHDLESIYKTTTGEFFASDEYFKYFEGNKFYLYFVPRPGDKKIAEGMLKLDDSHDPVRAVLQGKLGLVHKYDCNLVFDEHKNVYISGYGIGNAKGFDR